MNRRDLLKLSATAAALPRAGSAQPAAWVPALFDAHQNETVIALTERIIPATDTPGAQAAQVNRHLDRLLHDGPAEAQQEFLEGLSWLDAFAIRKYNRPFVRCGAAEQTALLESLDIEGNAFFRLAKGLTAQTYYATEIGFREMNKGGRVPATFACNGSDHA